MNKLLLTLLLLLGAGGSMADLQAENSAHNFSFASIDGPPIHLRDFKISSLLIVFIIYLLNSTSTSLGLLIKSLTKVSGDAFL